MAPEAIEKDPATNGEALASLEAAEKPTSAIEEDAGKGADDEEAEKEAQAGKAASDPATGLDAPPAKRAKVADAAETDDDLELPSDSDDDNDAEEADPLHVGQTAAIAGTQGNNRKKGKGKGAAAGATSVSGAGAGAGRGRGGASVSSAAGAASQPGGGRKKGSGKGMDPKKKGFRQCQGCMKWFALEVMPLGQIYCVECNRAVNNLTNMAKAGNDMDWLKAHNWNNKLPGPHSSKSTSRRCQLRPRARGSNCRNCWC